MALAVGSSDKSEDSKLLLLKATSNYSALYELLLLRQ